jgi:hypothetical protein
MHEKLSIALSVLMQNTAPCAAAMRGVPVQAGCQTQSAIRRIAGGEGDYRKNAGSSCRKKARALQNLLIFRENPQILPFSAEVVQ